MNAAELSRLHDYHEATLHAVREGLLMLDGQRRIALINDAGRELLGLAPGTVGRRVAELDLPAPLTGALLASEERVDEVHLTADRVIVVNTRPVVGGERRGTVITLRDHTELQALSGELDSERGFTQALRSQAHEAANRLHTVVSLIELDRAQEAVGFATAELELAQALTDRVVGAVAEPVLAALLLGKAAQANERGVELVLADDSLIDDGALPASLPQRDLVTVLGNLIDNAVDAASEAVAGPPDTVPADGAVPAQRTSASPRPVRARVTVTALAGDGELLLRVADNGTGVDPADAAEVFRRGWSTHGVEPRDRLGARTAGRAPQRRRGHTGAGARRRRGVHRTAAAAGGQRREREQDHMNPVIRVLVVEDDPVAADAHQLYVDRVPGFAVAAVAHSRAEAVRALERTPVDLLLLDLYLPDGHGLHLLRSLRAAGHTADVIAVTSARDLAVVREGVSLGVVQYVLKPFTFATLRDRLVRYAEFRAAAGEASGQDEVDRALASLRAPQPARLPKGLSGPTLEAVTRALRSAPDGVTAAAAGVELGISRITARRYLEHLVTAGRAVRSPQYGQIGRPELHYRWVAEAR